MKIMESIIRDKLLKFAQENSFITGEKVWLYEAQILLNKYLETLEDQTKALDSDYGIDIIYLDYQKAFDTVPHKRLLKKLKWHGFYGELLLWIEDFVTDRQIRVSVNGAYSDWAKVTSGVPWGLVLGLLLFLLYVNDIPACQLQN